MQENNSRFKPHSYLQSKLAAILSDLLQLAQGEGHSLYCCQEAWSLQGSILIFQQEKVMSKKIETIS